MREIKLKEEWNNNEMIRKINKSEKDIVKVNEQLDTIVQQAKEKGFVTYKEFGAKLNGVDDDTDAIIKCHNFANEYGLSVVQNNSNIVLNSEVVCKTNLDLGGSTLITNLVDVDLPYERTKNLFNFTGTKQEITNNVVQSEFLKDVTQINSLSNYNGYISIYTTDEFLYRRDGDNVGSLYKGEINSVKNGILECGLQYDYSTSTDFKVYLISDDINSIKIVSPKFVINSNNKFRSLFYFENINNIELSNLEINATLGNDNIALIYSPLNFLNCSNIKIYNINGNSFSQLEKNSNLNISYLVFTERCINISLDNLLHLKGWRSVDGRYSRNVVCKNSTLLSFGNHFSGNNYYLENSIILRNCPITGFGKFIFNNIEFSNLYSNICIQTRPDVGGFLDGDIEVYNSKANDFSRFIQLGDNNLSVGNIKLPNIKIDDITLFSSVDSVLIEYGTGSGNINNTEISNLVEIKNIKGEKISNKKHNIFWFRYELNSKITGNITFNCDNVNISRDTYLADVLNVYRCNFLIPKINNDTNFNLNVNNSTCNLGFLSTKNINVNINNSIIEMLHYDTSYDDLTYKANIEINNSKLNKPMCNVTADLLNVVVKNSQWGVFVKSDKTIDNNTGQNIQSLIRYSNNNYCTVNATPGATAKTKIYNYIDNVYYKNS